MYKTVVYTFIKGDLKCMTRQNSKITKTCYYPPSHRLTVNEISFTSSLLVLVKN